MHEKLIKQLRDTGKVSEALSVFFPQVNGNAMLNMLNEAADIIEEYDTKCIKFQNTTDDVLINLKIEYSNGYGFDVPVTKEEVQNVIACLLDSTRPSFKRPEDEYSEAIGISELEPPQPICHIDEQKPITNQEAMCKLSPEDFYAKLKWLWTSYGKEWTNSEYAIIEWLKQDSQK